ncbi:MULTISPECIES: hypothetical protein [unclassified Chitinophaga]|uniref:hypothetical protein n=1 Tax=unclassified Chitinophaga TaxID=2619133 RepID=UPI00300FC18D
MVQLKIKYLLSFIFPALISNSCSTDHQKAFTSEISHTSFFDPKAGWGKVYTFKPIGIAYQPKQQLMIISRLKVPDTLHMIQLTKDQQDKITAEYGEFRFLGAFEDHNLPFELSHLMYLNPSNLDILQIDRMTADAKGTEKFTRAILYMKDSINYMTENKLFIEQGK